MLDFNAASSVPARRTKTTQVRHDDRLANLIERAALALAVDKSEFLRAAIEREAIRILDFQSRHTLTPEDAEVFAAALAALPAPTARASSRPNLPGARGSRRLSLQPTGLSISTRRGTTALISTAVWAA